MEQPRGGSGIDEHVALGVIAVDAATGVVIWDGMSTVRYISLPLNSTLSEFGDGFMRSELETRLLHLGPSEVILSTETSKQTQTLVKNVLDE
jgi:DNA mismatch repair protein MSH3